MSCACGHHHHLPASNGHAGDPVTVQPALVGLTGRLICADTAQMMLALNLMPGHVAASRAEPGCLRFDIAQSDDPLIWTLDEIFADDAAFAAHQTRTKASDWGRQSGDIGRDFTRSVADVTIRAETPQDATAIGDLLTRAFGGPDEARLVAALRRDGDLALSLVAQSGGTILGHVALSPVSAPAPALALAPLAVHPALHGRGIGAALMRAALAAFADHTIIVLGDPAYYGRFGFQPADLASPYAGPHLMLAGPALPGGATIAHAPAFAEI